MTADNPPNENHGDPGQPPALSHVRRDGTAHIVDVSGKAVTKREARAQAILRTRPDVVAMITDGALPKGDALAVARVAGIMAAKQTSSLIPLCHPLPISRVTVNFEAVDAGTVDFGKDGTEPGAGSVLVTAVVATTAVTGVEMEALTAASIAALTLYDMIKAVDHTAVIGDIRVLAKSGGKSGDWSI